MSEFTEDQRKALDKWARTQPELRAVFPYTRLEEAGRDGLGEKLQDTADKAGSALQSVDNLDDVGDVDASNPSNGQVLKFNSTTGKWEPDTDETGGGGDVTFKDGTNSITGSELNVNENQFYLDTDKGGDAVLNLQPDLSLGQVTADEFDTGGFFDFTETIEPATPDANHIRIWGEDNQGKGVLKFKNSDGVVFELSRDSTQIVRNTSGALISKGELVYISGSTGQVPDVAKAQSNSATTMPAFGFAAEDIADNGFGQVIRQGDIQGIDTSSFTDGRLLYVSSSVAGGVQDTPPANPNERQRVGIVINAANNGRVAVNIEGVSLSINADNFYMTSDSRGLPVLNLSADLQELDDTDVASPNDNDVLTFDAASGKWKAEASSGGSSLTVTDGVNTFNSVSELNVSDDGFYISSDADGNPVINRDYKWVKETKLGSNAATIDLTDFPIGANLLYFELFGRDSAGGGGANVAIQLYDESGTLDTGSNYDCAVKEIKSGSITWQAVSGEGTGKTKIRAGTLSGTNAASEIGDFFMGTLAFWFDNRPGATKNATFVYARWAAIDDIRVGFVSWTWRKNENITGIRFINDTNDFVAGSGIRVYGVE